jgi:hypothetical protein
MYAQLVYHVCTASVCTASVCTASVCTHPALIDSALAICLAASMDSTVKRHGKIHRGKAISTWQQFGANGCMIAGVWMTVQKVWERTRYTSGKVSSMGSI